MTSSQFSSVIGCNATANPQVVAKLNCFDLLWICCGLVVQLVVQQIHNKSNKWSLTLTGRPQHLIRTTAAKSQN